ncbi:cyclic diguanylate phosphodiesterase (EAL) domain-containing protein [Klebsiella pneumoniae]|uniref:Cyclic diguanylate phosphodiesterase (EAL) domain-containing protein n=1 Tax=Klebsiella pneumoniae TaxID=573 RepID=A0A377TZG6_KLEPN|nr:cyclic diguanylate phosphodiesterase (EAL) domain-containing protein [Klebsiella pneumoniae]
MNTKIFEDNILSRNDIAVRYVFQKMFPHKVLWSRWNA